MSIEKGSTRMFFFKEHEYKMLLKHLSQQANNLPLGNEKMALLGLSLKLESQWEDNLFKTYLSKQTDVSSTK